MAKNVCLVSALLVLCGYALVYSEPVRDSEEKMIVLPKPRTTGSIPLEEAIWKRRSVRSFSDKKMTLEQVSQLLWAAQGVTDERGLRAAPSAGASYPLEVYIAKSDGVFHYEPERHALEVVSEVDIRQGLAEASLGQRFIAEAPVSMILVAVKARITSRYGKRGERYVDIEVGHAAQNVHLEAVALGLASVPVGAFDDAAIADLLKLPKGDEAVYIIPLGYAR